MNYREDAQKLADEIELLLHYASDSPREVQAWLAQHACVMASSYLETSLRAEILVHVHSRVIDYHVVQYVEAGLRRLGNPSSRFIIELVGRFGTDVRVALEDSFHHKQRVSIDSIRTNRNHITHGYGGTSGLSLGLIREYFRDSKAVVKSVREVLSRSNRVKPAQ